MELELDAKNDFFIIQMIKLNHEYIERHGFCYMDASIPCPSKTF
jgi:hypothetical protein